LSQKTLLRLDGP